MKLSNDADVMCAVENAQFKVIEFWHDFNCELFLDIKLVLMISKLIM